MALLGMNKWRQNLFWPIGLAPLPVVFIEIMPGIFLLSLRHCSPITVGWDVDNISHYIYCLSSRQCSCPRAKNTQNLRLLLCWCLKNESLHCAAFHCFTHYIFVIFPRVVQKKNCNLLHAGKAIWRHCLNNVNIKNPKQWVVFLTF